MTSWRRYVRPILNPTCSLFRCKIVTSWRRYVRPILNPTLSEFCTSLTGITQVFILPTFLSLIYLLIYLMGVSPDGGLGSPRWRFFQILPLFNLIYSSSYRSTLINGFLPTYLSRTRWTVLTISQLSSTCFMNGWKNIGQSLLQNLCMNNIFNGFFF